MSARSVLICTAIIAGVTLLRLPEAVAAPEVGGGGGGVQLLRFDCCNHSLAAFECDSRRERKQIDCDERDLWLVSPGIYPEDNFTLRPDGVLVVGEAFPISYTKYCIGWTNLSAKRSEAAIVCSLDFLLEGEDQVVAVAACLLLSSVCALLTLLVYCLLPELRDLQGKTIMCMLVSISIGYPTLGFMQLYTSELGDSACVLSAIVIFFWLLATFCWLNISCFNIWRSVALADKRFKEKTLFIAYSIYGWGVPILFLLVVLLFEFVIDHSLKPNFGLTKCWFHRDTEIWIFFYGPISILLTTNVFFFASTMYHLWNVVKTDSPSMSESKLKKLKYKCRLYIRLFLTMGITFIFEIMSFALEKNITNSWKTWWDIMDIINALQGVILFVILVLTRKKVLRGLSTVRFFGYQLCCIKTSWDNFEDEETDNEHEVHANDMQLGNERQ